jgi:hypothetical protein
MKQMMILVAGALLSFCAHAADKPATQKSQADKTTEWTKDQREAMAKNHETMAACLRSDKSVTECHDEMMKSCQASDSCPMKGRMGMHHGMMRNNGNK